MAALWQYVIYGITKLFYVSLFINLFAYMFIQPFAFIVMFVLLIKKYNLSRLNKFLRYISLIPFLTFTIFILFAIIINYDTYLIISDVFIIRDMDTDIRNIPFPFYSWVIAGSYFILYPFNKKNKLGIYIYLVLFIIFATLMIFIPLMYHESIFLDLDMT